MRRRAPSLIFVFITLLLDVLGFGLLIPVSPRLIAYVQGLPMEGAEHDASTAVGLLMATFAAMQFIFSPIMGSLSDRFGRRPVLLIALLGSALDYFVAAAVPGLWVLFITRALNGVSGATVSVCSAYIADVTPPEKRAAGYGIIGAAFGMGFVFGPLVGGVLGDDKLALPLIGHGHVTYPYIAAGVLTLGNFLFGLLVMPESLPREHRRPFSWSKANPLGAIKWLTRHPVVLTLAVSLLLLNIAQFGLHSTWVLSMTARFNWSTTQVGWSMFVVGISAAIVQGGLARKIIPKFGERACLLFGIVLGVAAFCAYGLATHGWMIYLFIAIASLGGVAGPAVQAITSKAVGPTEQGLLQGALGSLGSVAGVAGPVIATAAFRAATPGKPPFAFPGASAPFFTGAVLMLLALAPIAVVWRRMPRTVAESPDESEAGSDAPESAGLGAPLATSAFGEKAREVTGDRREE